jgi:glycerophosphoryl diester phosphodiesterase
MKVTKNPLLAASRRIVIGHRGNPVAFAENTIESLQSALAVGVDALEFDVRVSRDGVVVVMHDETLDRTTNATGRVNALDWRELETLDAAARAPTRGQGQLRIPRLEQILERFREIPLIIEVKELAAADATERLVRQFGAQERVLIGSVENAVSERFYRSGLATCASMNDAMLLVPLALVGMTPRRPDFDVLSVPPVYRGVPVPVHRMTAAVARVGVPTHVWTVNDPVAAVRYWEAGVAGIVTDDAAAMVRARPS